MSDVSATVASFTPADVDLRGSMDELKGRLSGLLSFLPVERPLVYLDYPVHLNFGDLLIMKGTERFFADCGHRIEARAAYMSFSDSLRRRITGDTILVMHGGGNFGDLYPVHQRFREQVVRQFPDNRIVVLPQSVYFSSASALEQSAEVFRAHRDIVLCLRDHASVRRAGTRFTHNTVLMPDMAHQLWRRPPPEPTADDRILVLMRRDLEMSQDQTRSGGVSHSRDWLDFIPRWSCRIFGKILRLHELEGRSGLRLGAQRVWYRYCDLLHTHMEKQFQGYGQVVTSRLHGMIFAALLNKRARYLDNTYGKLTGYANTWFDDSVRAQPCAGTVG
ncbi:MAG: polysaccharide pyruvyl transferase family protein [Proteobacteria bacterium]|nr:polysaccharide pyruvyl transferase family protein [Pseudomonadota bacterium]